MRKWHIEMEGLNGEVSMWDVWGDYWLALKYAEMQYKTMIALGGIEFSQEAFRSYISFGFITIV